MQEDFSFSYNFAGSRHLIYRFKNKQGFPLVSDICFRMKLALYKRERIRQVVSWFRTVLKKKQAKFQKDLSILIQKKVDTLAATTINWFPFYTFDIQRRLHNRLYSISQKKNVSFVPKHFYTDGSNFQILEFLIGFISLNEFSRNKQLHLRKLASTIDIRNRIDSKIIEMIAFWESVGFSHNDNHSRNILIHPETLELRSIDFDTGKFGLYSQQNCSDREVDY